MSTGTNQPPINDVLIAALAAGILWHFPVKWAMRFLWKRYYKVPGVDEVVGDEEIHGQVQPFILILGVLERMIYAGTWIYGLPEAIAVILALKAAPGIKEWSEKKSIGRAAFNIWLIGNFLSIIGSVIIAELVPAISV